GVRTVPPTPVICRPSPATVEEDESVDGPEDRPADVERPGRHSADHTPTDIAQFIRLEQCEQYLRLRPHTRALGAHAAASELAGGPPELPAHQEPPARLNQSAVAHALRTR